MWVFVTKQIILTRAIQTYKDLFTCAMSEPHHSYIHASVNTDHHLLMHTYATICIPVYSAVLAVTKNKTYIYCPPPPSPHFSKSMII